MVYEPIKKPSLVYEPLVLDYESHAYDPIFLFLDAYQPIKDAHVGFLNAKVHLFLWESNIVHATLLQTYHFPKILTLC